MFLFWLVGSVVVVFAVCVCCCCTWWGGGGRWGGGGMGVHQSVCMPIPWTWTEKVNTCNDNKNTNNKDVQNAVCDVYHDIQNSVSNVNHDLQKDVSNSRPLERCV